MNTSTAAQSQRRKSSRTNSTSSSVVTVKPASVSSRSGSRTPHSFTPARSPDQLGPQLSALLQSTSEAAPKEKRSSSWSRPGSSEIREGVGNLNRWSQSTDTDASGQENGHKRKRTASLSKHLSIGPLPSLGPSRSNESTQMPNHREARSSSSRRSPGRSGLRRGPPTADPPSLALPPIEPLPLLSTSAFAQESPSPHSATPLTSELITPTGINGSHDYFGEQWRPVQYPHDTNGPSAPSRTPNMIEKPRALRIGHSSGKAKGLLATNIAVKPTLSDNRGASRSRGHSRHWDDDKQSSGYTEEASSASELTTDDERPPRRRGPVQKTMLSQALEKANTAVLLDNAQNFEGAIKAYDDACRLLHEVLLRSSGPDDKRKLQAIRTTYTNRVAELLSLGDSIIASGGKALPERPLSDETLSPSAEAGFEEEPYGLDDESSQQSLAPYDLPPRRQSLLPFAYEHPSTESLPQMTQISHPRLETQTTDDGTASLLSVGSTLRPEYMPPPLSPRRPRSPYGNSAGEAAENDASRSKSEPTNHNRDLSTETTSWLNTIDESGDSSASSLYSRNSSALAHGRSHSGYSADETEARFNAAMNAAVDAAYEDPACAEPVEWNGSVDEDIITMARRNIELAKEMVREAEREAAAEEKQRKAHQEEAKQQQERDIADEVGDDDYLDEEAEEEERLLEEMTRGYIIDDFDFNIQSKSALPRKSDSSGFSGGTGASSVGSTTLTAITSLSTLAETLPPPTKSKLPPPPHPPPVGALPIPPVPTTVAPPPPTLPPARIIQSRPSSFERPFPLGPGVRDRRLSGQNAKQLKIETGVKPSLLQTAPSSQPPTLPFSVPQGPPSTASSTAASVQSSVQTGPRSPPSTTQFSQPSTPLASVASTDSVVSQSPATPALIKQGSLDGDDSSVLRPPSPARFNAKAMPPPTVIRKNFSSSSLKIRSMSVTDVSEPSPGTPASGTFPLTREHSRDVSMTMPVARTPIASAFAVPGLTEGSLHLFDDPIRIPQTPNTPGSHRPNAPPSLEPCPNSFLLRPFWLMRCLYQTITHPRGGYITSKLFVPRDIWRVKNVKLKGLDDKVSQCDLLTAALLKLAKVDDQDADAMLEEMQSFEAVLDQVRVTLQKKLGNEVGLTGSAALFKGSPAADEAQGEVLTSKNANATPKSYLSGWRKLRSKPSSAGINATYGTTGAGKDSNGKDAMTMPSLPMTITPVSSRFAKRNTTILNFTGPNANYMGALARLFDAVQVLDSIAQQVEDPGLKCSSKTHVGLELSVRNAVEFFGFYVCRFVLGDIGIMLDKFIKRGSEWVLA